MSSAGVPSLIQRCAFCWPWSITQSISITSGNTHACCTIASSIGADLQRFLSQQWHLKIHNRPSFCPHFQMSFHDHTLSHVVLILQVWQKIAATWGLSTAPDMPQMSDKLQRTERWGRKCWIWRYIKKIDTLLAWPLPGRWVPYRAF